MPLDLMTRERETDLINLTQLFEELERDIKNQRKLKSLQVAIGKLCDCNGKDNLFVLENTKIEYKDGRPRAFYTCKNCGVSIPEDI